MRTLVSSCFCSYFFSVCVCVHANLFSSIFFFESWSTYRSTLENVQGRTYERTAVRFRKSWKNASQPLFKQALWFSNISVKHRYMELPFLNLYPHSTGEARWSCLAIGHLENSSGDWTQDVRIRNPRHYRLSYSPPPIHWDTCFCFCFVLFVLVVVVVVSYLSNFLWHFLWGTV